MADGAPAVSKELLDKEVESCLMQYLEYASSKLNEELDDYMMGADEEDGNGMNE